MEMVKAMVASISIHAPAGGRQRIAGVVVAQINFNPRPPARGATPPDWNITSSYRISIHAPREGGDRPYLRLGLGEGISIHAPREGGDR